MKSFVGIDWSQSKHNVVLYNSKGAQLLQKEVAHTQQGFEQLDKALHQVNPERSAVCILVETDHNQLVDFLWDKGYSVYIIAPSVVTANRGRQTISGSRTDDSDAALLADILRTDQGRLLRWQPDSHLVRQLRIQCSLVDDLTASIVRYHNRLDALLRRHYPQPRVAFKNLTVPTWLAWLSQHPSQAALRATSYAEFEQFCWQRGHRRHAYLHKAWELLQQPAPYAVSDVPLAAAEIAHVSSLLLTLVKQKASLLTAISTTYDQHPDAAIFRSVPGAGDLLSAKLLTLFGDQRSRWPSPQAVQSVAGTCPATSQSGKLRVVFFRKSCNRTHRTTCQQLALQSVKQSDWAASYVAKARLRGHTLAHAYRCLANRWLTIIWTLWQRRVPYDKAHHLQDVARCRRP